MVVIQRINVFYTNSIKILSGVLGRFVSKEFHSANIYPADVLGLQIWSDRAQTSAWSPLSLVILAKLQTLLSSTFNIK